MPDAAPAAQLPLPARGTLLGFDFGLARIGVATGELETGQCSALTTLHDESNDIRFKTIARLIDEWRPVALVVGIIESLSARLPMRWVTRYLSIASAAALLAMIVIGLGASGL